MYRVYNTTRTNISFSKSNKRRSKKKQNRRLLCIASSQAVNIRVVQKCVRSMRETTTAGGCIRAKIGTYRDDALAGIDILTIWWWWRWCSSHERVRDRPQFISNNPVLRTYKQMPVDCRIQILFMQNLRNFSISLLCLYYHTHIYSSLVHPSTAWTALQHQVRHWYIVQTEKTEMQPRHFYILYIQRHIIIVMQLDLQCVLCVNGNFHFAKIDRPRKSSPVIWYLRIRASHVSIHNHSCFHVYFVACNLARSSPQIKRLWIFHHHPLRRIVLSQLICMHWSFAAEFTFYVLSF